MTVISSKRGENSRNQYNTNRVLILKMILNHPDITRRELSQQTGLTQAAITKIMKDLIDQQVVFESKVVKGSVGAPSIGLRVDVENYQVIGVKLSRYDYSIGWYRLDHQLMDQRTYPFDSNLSAHERLEEISLRLNRLIDEIPQIIYIGFAVPGPYNLQEGKIELMTEVGGFEKVFLRDYFENTLSKPVVISHDANAAALACKENYLNQAENETLAFYYLDQGVGCGVIDRGSFVLGNLGTAAEIGHTTINFTGPPCPCGNVGCLETYCSTVSFLKRAKEKAKTTPTVLKDLPQVSMSAIFDHYETDDVCREVVDETVEALCVGATVIISAYNPSLLVLGGEMLKGHKFIQPRLEAMIKERIIPSIANSTRVVYTQPQDDYVLKGAASVAIEASLNYSNELFNRK
ncbi:hypothetical protein CJ205_01150 [Dolosicoccus paucivorans]|uniref:ROK family transcriptional regulator n=1 Tax=Dolosicoccus paucivorans TaxID=84521 RepID=A0A2N6SPV0_9LACT|nr:ROK family transcriptional regulator [Dolosicoccus paucivorans]PMC59103.1 hypothetical protein CJ205_01150 [Dolosicoccus paucivorans]